MTRRALVGCEMSAMLREALAATGYWDEIWSADVLPTEVLPDVQLEAGLDPVFNGRTHPDSRVLTGHYCGDVLDLFRWDHPVNARRAFTQRMYADAPLWDAAFMFPPCTHLSLAGAVWWKKKRATPSETRPPEIPDGEFFSVQDHAAWFFMRCVNAPAPYVAVENPRGDMTRRWRPPDQYVQPHMFGEPLIKQTGLWLKGLPPLTADDPVEPAGRVATGGGSWRTDMKHGRGANNGHEDGKGRKNRQRERNRTLPGVARAMAQQWTKFIQEQERAAA